MSVRNLKRHKSPGTQERAFFNFMRACAFVLLCSYIILFSSRHANADKVNVFVSIPPQKYFVERIAAELVDVKVMVPAGASPATYEPTPQQMAQLAQAKIYFRIGVPFENQWIIRLSQNYPELKIVDLRDHISLREMKVGHHLAKHEDHGHHGHDHDHAHDHGQLDPHIWLSPALVRTQTRTIAEALVNVFPNERQAIQKNTTDFQEELKELSIHIQQKLNALPTRQMMVFHPAWGYFADEFNLTQIPIEIEGKEPSIREMAMLVDIAKKEKISVIFVQKQFSDKMARALAQSIQAKVVPIDPLAEDYLFNMMRIAQTLEDHLKE